MLSPKTAKYVAALISQGDNFDYFKWLHLREEECQANQTPAPLTPGNIIAPEFDPPLGTTDCPNGSLKWGSAAMTGPLPVRRVVYPSHHNVRDASPKARLTRRLEKIGEAWDDFQASRARDAVYGYLEAVFAIVEHYKVRRK